MEEMPITPRGWFEQPRSPAEFYRAAEASNSGLPQHVFFEKRVGDENIQYLFDAFTAGEFAMIVSQTSPCRVALVRGEFPDFLLAFDDPDRDDEEFEAVEADKAGRRRADEYRALHEVRLRHGPGYLDLEEYSPYEEEMQAREAIPRVVGQKAAKRYPANTNRKSVV